VAVVGMGTAFRAHASVFLDSVAHCARKEDA